MAYTAEISRRNPSAFLFLVDRSESMEDRFPDGKRKCEGVAEALNRLIYELAIKCTTEGGVAHYYDVGALGYGATVEPAFSGALAGRSLLPIAEVAANPARLEQRTRVVRSAAGEQVSKTVRVPVWFDPVAAGATPMSQAIERAREILRDWVETHPGAYPPTVVNITDGESTDGDPTAAMRELRQLSTTDGNVLLFNVHISSDPQAKPRSFPHSADGLPNAYARVLYANSSMLTPFMCATARQIGFEVNDDAKGFVLNADLLLVVQALDIGTRAGNPLR